MDFPLSAAIREARALATKRDRLVEAIARRWAVALRGQPVSAQDLGELWAGLEEEAARCFLKGGRRRWDPEAVRLATMEVIARVRARVEQALAESRDGRSPDA